jgi:basic membrane protein A
MTKTVKGLLTSLLTLTLLATACGGNGSSDSGAKSQLKVAGVFAGSITASGWDREGYAAFKGMAAALGATESHEESVAYDQAPEVLKRLGQQGFDIIVAHSSGFEPAVLQVAGSFPKTWFLIYSDLSTTNGLKNVAGWKANWNELGYLQGATACLATKSGKIGVIGSAPIPAFTRQAGGVKQATEEVGKCKGNPGAFNNIWTGSFTDVAKAKQAALAIIGKGADVLMDGADAAGSGSVEAAKEKSAYYIGGIVDQSQDAPSIMITSVWLDFKASYDEMAQLYKDKKLEAKVYNANVSNGGVKLVTPFKNVSDPNIEKQVTDLYNQIKNGTIKVDATKEVKP